MDGLTFIASLVHSVAWPGAAAVFALSQRKALTGFIGKIKTAKAFGAEIGVAEQIEAVREQVEAAPQAPALPPAAQQLPSPANIGLEGEAAGDPHLSQSKMIAELNDELAASSAVGSIVASWLQLNNGLKELAVFHGVTTSRESGLQTVRTLRSLGVLNDETYDAINKLRTIRNKVVHAGDPSISLVDAQAFRRSVQEILEKLGFNASLMAWR